MSNIPGKAFRAICNMVMLVAVFLFVGCSNGGIVIIDGQVTLLKDPYPLEYPSSDPQPNEIVSILNSGDRGEILDINYGKDYKVYKVKMNNGKTGYLIHGDNFRVISRP